MPVIKQVYKKYFFKWQNIICSKKYLSIFLCGYVSRLLQAVFRFSTKIERANKKQCVCILLHWSSVPGLKSADITVRAYEATAFCKMSTGKRLAKRSILGTRVVAPGEDGRLYPGMIQVNKKHRNQGLHPQVLQKTDTGVKKQGYFIVKILNLYIIHLCTHLYHFSPVCIKPFLSVLLYLSPTQICICAYDLRFACPYFILGPKVLFPSCLLSFLVTGRTLS